MQQTEIERFRAETTGTRHVIHFNNAGSSLMPDVVWQAAEHYIQQEALYGGYEMQDRFAADFEKVYTSLARLLNCSPSEIALTDSATTAWDRAFYSLPLHQGDRILTSQSEYASNYIAYLQVAHRTGVSVEVIPADAYGQVSVEALERMMDERVKLISVSHIPTNGGLVNPAAEIGRIARKYNVWYLLDACQSVGQMPVDVREIGCDMLTATGRKFLRSPRGTGFLYISKHLLEWIEPVTLDLHAARWTSRDSYQFRADARRFETIEANFAARLGLGKALGYAMDAGLENIWQRIFYLAQYLRNQLSKIQGVAVHDQGEVKCGIVTFTVEGKKCFELRDWLRTRGINTSVSVREHTLLDMSSRNLQEMMRASVHYYNTEEEVDKLCAALRSLSTAVTYPDFSPKK